jgi:hypothetical protein
MIQSLEDVNAIQRTHAPTKDESRERQLLINLSKEFGLLCSLTTFIAIEHRSLEERNEGRPALRRVPVQLAEGWGGVVVGAGCTIDQTIDLCKAAPAQSPAALTMDRSMAPASARRPGLISRMTGKLAEALTPGFNSGPPLPPRKHGASADRSIDPPVLFDGLSDRLRELPKPTVEELNQILSAQQADGSFAWTDEIRFSVGVWRTTIGGELAVWAGNALPAAVADTLAVLLLLKRQFAEHEALWQRAARKAIRDFLAPALGKTPAEVEKWLTEVLKSAIATG